MKFACKGQSTHLPTHMNGKIIRLDPKAFSTKRYEDVLPADVGDLKKGGPQGPLRFGKRRGPSGPLRFGKRSAYDYRALFDQQPYYFV
ncbi:hypothetical protein TELCIR_02801 [Teladorsagia circumcincta]|uniref:Uncharacterized protein n=1 Tax=Teladorsagia circumcincta TaxID=45464 RepID=A0A2G9UY39_TELCI|nr:hypothetical protein TELCIR_02801 [Teladorsagia circumcincta]